MKRVLVKLFAVIVMLGITGCSNDANPIIEENLLCESIISPNEKYIEDDKDISESDISIEWMTLMGSDKPTKENQKVIATVKISDGDKVVSERKINFAKNAIDVIVESI